MEIIKNRIYSELLSQGNYLRLNKRLIAVLGLEMAVFMCISYRQIRLLY